jgi:hypothetical protein
VTRTADVEGTDEPGVPMRSADSPDSTWLTE